MATNRALLSWYERKVAEYGPDAILTCADCGRQDRHHYVQPQHPSFAEGREDVALCGACIGARNVRYRAERKALLAARPKDCDRCGARPHTWRVAGWKLCGPCKTATMREHAAAASRVGWLAMTATEPMVDTRGWAARQATVTTHTTPEEV